MLATGGLVGSGGVAGTGLLANTGDPGNVNPTVGGVLVQTGQTVKDVSAGASQVASGLDGAVPGNTGLLTATTNTVHDEGQALVDTGNGQGYLVDGVTAATNDLASAGVNDQNVIGKGQNSQVGVSVASETQNEGQLLTVGVASGGQAVTVESPLLGGTGTGGVLGGGQSGGTGGASGGAVGGVVGGVENTVGSVLGGGQSGNGQSGSGGGLLGGGLLGGSH